MVGWWRRHGGGSRVILHNGAFFQVVPGGVFGAQFSLGGPQWRSLAA